MSDVDPLDLLRRLVQFETVNPPGAERECVTWVEELLRDAGLDTRIVAKDAGQGAGTRLLQKALDWLYIETETNRIDLDLFVENERARRAYEKLGFIVEGRLRDYHRSVDGRIRDALIMSILRKDWAKRHRL